MAGEYLTPTPYANPLTGLSNDMIQGLLGYMKDKQRTQQMQGLAGLLESTGIPQSVERAAYADSPKALLDALTNVNRANVPLLKPETADAIMNIAPMIGPAARVAERGAMAAGRAGERVAEKYVPQIMESGGLPAQLLGDLSQGSRRQIFIGQSSPIYDKNAAIKAQKMEKSNKSVSEIKAETGMEKTPSGEWVQEISDVGSQFKPDVAEQLNDYGVRKQKTVFEHPKAYEAYQDLGDVVLTRDGSKIADYTGYHDADKNLIGLALPRKDVNLESARDTNLHELQHAIQTREGWAQGGNPQMFEQQEAATLSRDALNWNKEIENAKKRYPNEDRAFLESVVVDDYMKSGVPEWIPSIEARGMANLFAKYSDQNDEAQKLVQLYGLDRKTTPFTPDQMYKNLEGEAMARSVQRRRNLTDEQLRQYPAFEPKSELNPYGLDVELRNLLYLNDQGEIRRSLLD